MEQEKKWRFNTRFLPASMKVVWWVCEKSRMGDVDKQQVGQNCLTAQEIGYGNDLQSKHPEIKSWHSQR